jgi:hypothetical protein
MIKPEQIKSELMELFPEFESQWESDHNYFRQDDGSFTQAGIFAELSHFIRDRFPDLPQDKTQRLFAQVEGWITCGQTDIENAVATCFLENIAGEPFSNEVRHQLGPKAREYFDNWNG